MKKSGYTLIELVMVMTILFLVFTVFLSFNNFEKRILYQIESDYASCEIQDFFTFSKLWCKTNKTYGSIMIHMTERKIYLVSKNHNTIKVVNLPESIDIFVDTESNNKITTIPISKNGRIDKAFTINLKNKLNEVIEITVSVGVDKISIKDKRQY